MEFHEKLKELRARRGITQEELAEALYVSRTAISKWESGRGYPNLDSLKAVAAYFSVTVDDLLSEGDLPSPQATPSDAPAPDASPWARLRSPIVGLADLSMALLLFLPLFASRGEGGEIRAVSLTGLLREGGGSRVACMAVVIALILTGLVTLTAELLRKPVAGKRGYLPSLCLGVFAILLFVLALQPYAAIFGGIALAVKVFFAIKCP